MTQMIDNQLIFEVLKKIQADVSVIKADLADVGVSVDAEFILGKHYGRFARVNVFR
jgi:hypothetical protein